MNLIKAVTGNVREQTVVTRQYTNVQFGDKFSVFLEALTFDNVISPDYVRTNSEAGHVWSQGVREGMVNLTTSNHPLAERGNAGTITVAGSTEIVELFELALSAYANSANITN